jgi:hypothetical protein
MRYIPLFLILYLHAGHVFGQKEARVASSMFNAQIGIPGIWLNHEARLADHWVLRSEVGLTLSIDRRDLPEPPNYIIGPVVNLEPRWYYNLDRRLAKGKPTESNSGNYLALLASYIPNWFHDQSAALEPEVTSLSLIPTWGIRRLLSSRWHYEAGFGAGYLYVFNTRNDLVDNRHNYTLNLHLRLGYRL